MKNILIIGGMGTGKTTLAKTLCEKIPDCKYIYMSQYAVRIPMTLMRTTHPNLTFLPREKFIQTIFENVNIAQEHFTRFEMDAFGREVEELYGKDIFAHIGFEVAKPHMIALLDNMPRVENVRYLKEKGFFIVGLKCLFEEQVKRRLHDRMNIDPDTLEAMEKQVKTTNEDFDVENTLLLADVIYDTTKEWSNDEKIVQEIISKVTQ